MYTGKLSLDTGIEWQGFRNFVGYQMHSYDNKGKDIEAKLRLWILSRNLQN